MCFRKRILVRIKLALGVTRRLIGFAYAVFMIEQIASGQSSVHLITKRLYSETAKHFGVKPHFMERALRTLVNSCWEYRGRETLSDIAGRALTQAPSNSDFLDMLAAYIKTKTKTQGRARKHCPSEHVPVCKSAAVCCVFAG